MLLEGFNCDNCHVLFNVYHSHSEVFFCPSCGKNLTEKRFKEQQMWDEMEVEQLRRDWEQEKKKYSGNRDAYWKEEPAKH